MTAFPAGRLKDRVALERRALDANGDRLGDWEAIATCAASILYRVGTETVLQSRLEGAAVVEVVVRDQGAIAGLGTGWRVRDVRKGRIFDVTAIAWDRPERGFLSIAAKADAVG